MKVCVRDYLSENPDASYRQIKARFGNPRQIALSYTEEFETEDLLDLLQLNCKVITIILAVVSVMLTSWLTMIVMMYYDHRKDVNGYMVVEEVVVIDRTENDEGAE